MTAEQAIDILNGIRADNLNLNDEYTKDKYDALGMAIQALEQEPKTGHWIVWNTSSYDWTYKCDKCGCIAHNNSDYCPKCGADMRGEQHEVND